MSEESPKLNALPLSCLLKYLRKKTLLILIVHILVILTLGFDSSVHPCKNAARPFKSLHGKKTIQIDRARKYSNNNVAKQRYHWLKENLKKSCLHVQHGFLRYSA